MLREDRAHLRKAREDLLDLRPELLNSIQRRALNFHAQWSLDASQGHIQTILHRHSPGVCQPGKLELLVHFANELLVGHIRPPLLTRFQHESWVIHIERSIVCGAVGPAYNPEDAFHLRKRSQNSVLLLQKL